MAVLASYGIRVKGTGYDQGTITGPILKNYFENTTADLSALTIRDDFEGFHDYVFIDPFQEDGSRMAAQYAVKHGKPYVTIDCPYDSYYAENCAVAALSNDFLQNAYPGIPPEELMQKYMEGRNALYIFTYGADTVYYGRSGNIKKMSPYKIKAMSTLGAGDSFRTGCIYGLYKGMSDDELVDFACAMAACACQVYPLAEHLPTLESIQRMQESRD